MARPQAPSPQDRTRPPVTLVAWDTSPMRSFHALLGAAAVVAALAFIGCGETVIDATKTEEALEANLSKSLNQKVASVNCPSDIEVEKGTTFNCSVKLQKGQEQTATLKILNSDADVSVINLSGSNE